MKLFNGRDVAKRDGRKMSRKKEGNSYGKERGKRGNVGHIKRDENGAMAK